MALSEYGPKMYRTLVEVAGMDTERGMVNLVIPGWNPNVTVTIAAIRVQPPELLERVRNGGYLLARLNLAAETPGELMLGNFAQAPVLESELG